MLVLTQLKHQIKELNMDILLVDDNKQLVELMSAFFDISNYKYRTACCGEKAIEEVKKHNFKVIILDINLGYTPLNGVELCLLLRKSNKESKIYALTAYSELFHDISPEVAGFDKAFFKPSGYRDLLKVIENDIISD